MEDCWTSQPLVARQQAVATWMRVRVTIHHIAWYPEGVGLRWQWNRSKTRSVREETTLKPIPPRIYDGSADTRAYHHFIHKSEAYLQDGRVRGTRRRVFNLSHFLEGKLYDFYMQKVASNGQDWPLPCFFKELFDYCFPTSANSDFWLCDTMWHYSRYGAMRKENVATGHYRQI